MSGTSLSASSSWNTRYQPLWSHSTHFILIFFLHLKSVVPLWHNFSTATFLIRRQHRIKSWNWWAAQKSFIEPVALALSKSHCGNNWLPLFWVAQYKVFWHKTMDRFVPFTKTCQDFLKFPEGGWSVMSTPLLSSGAGWVVPGGCVRHVEVYEIRKVKDMAP